MNACTWRFVTIAVIFLGLLSLPTCHQSDPVEELVRGRLRSLSALLPTYFQTEYGKIASEISKGTDTYADISEDFGKTFQAFAMREGLSIRFNEAHRMVIGDIYVVEVWMKLNKSDQLSLRFVARNQGLVGPRSPENIVVELPEVYTIQRS